MEQHQAFLQTHPSKLNEYFRSSYRSWTPLDCALLCKHVNIVHMLLARNAKLSSCGQDELNEFLRAHPNPQKDSRGKQQEKTKEEKESRVHMPVTLSATTQQKLQQGTLGHMSEEEITRELEAGKLTCGFSDQLAWPDIVKRVEEHENARAQQMNPVTAWRQEQANIHTRRQDVQSELDRLQQELVQLNQQHQQLEQRIQDHAMKDLSGLLAFARRVQPIEQRLVAHLEVNGQEESPTRGSVR